MNSEKKLFVIDVMPLLYRGHFVFLRNPRMTTTGVNTSALYIFASALVQLIEEYKPTHVALAFDSRTPTFRHKMYPAYKAKREKMPEDISAGIDMAIELADAMRIPVIRIDGFEADDVMGTLAQKAVDANWEAWLSTPDKDIAQLVAPKVYLHRPGKGGKPSEVYDEAAVCENWKISSVSQMIDYLGMAGDASDNIPGIPGVGEKTAQKLLAEYGSLEEVIAHASDLKGKMAEKVRDGAESARLSYVLATIRKDVPLGIELDDLNRKEPDIEKLKSVLQKFELNTIAQRLFGDGFTVGAASVASVKHLADVPHTYECVTSEEQIVNLIKILGNTEMWAFDTETNGLDARHDSMVGISFATEPGKAWYVPVPDSRDECTAFLKRFEPLFEDEQITKLGHNIKFDITILSQYGVEVRGPIRDSMIAHYVADAADRHGMDYLANQVLNYEPIPITALIGTKKRGVEQLTMGEIIPENISDYAAEDADVTLQLDKVLRAQAEEFGCLFALTECEEPLIRVLVDMEREGVRIDDAALHVYGRELDRELLQLDIDIRDMGGSNFNPASPKQLGEVLFERLKLDDKAKRTASGQFATGEEVLVKIKDRHPIVPKILDFRACSKLKSTYVDKLPKCIDPATGRVHTNFSQSLTETGRLSSSNPNLQNIPVRTERGRHIRAAFVARDENHVLMSADYSQIELRIMAAFSKDRGMLEAFKNNLDIHRETAARVYDMMPGLVTDEMRSAAKMVNFGIIYGISAFGLSQRLNIPRKAAAVLINNYFAQYPGVKTYMDQSIADAKEKGYAVTLLGRRRYLRDINSRNGTTRQSAERNAINTPIQGTSADLIKLAMVNMDRALLERGLKTKMVLQIHDELLLDVPKNEVDEVRELVANVMSGVYDIGVPLDVSVGVGTNWLEAH
ncbi:MAG: DNA polymerase I [Kiritimatiellae bacterium]|nr:DNA polymerase I [Kiritimatiellia bacterium]